MKNLQSSTKFQLLEINLISAQQLKLPRFSLSKNHKIYAVVWIDPKQKLRSRAKPGLLGNPSFHYKFVFMVDAKMLDSWSTTQLVFEFYCIRRFEKDRLIGTSRVWLGNGLLCQVTSDLVIGMTSAVDFQKLMIGRTNRADEKRRFSPFSLKPKMVSEQQETSVESPKSPPSTLEAQNAAKENNGSGSSSGASSFSALPGFKGNLNFM
ncbi:hypothetical protein TIFTF001_003399 [Ficus carica]|uniref:C2 domain-containing protein n=1 Tax=Ficus carica TaxID=3494 RepID=A0AA87Z8Z8_FICCA|nr:hypothetical protein TIFTF001_003399 [Ficus carica]